MCQENELTLLLSAVNLGHLMVPLKSQTLNGLVELSGEGRVGFLKALKELGVSKLADRQALVSAIARFSRGNQIGPAKPNKKPLHDMLLSKDFAKLNPRSAGSIKELKALPVLGSGPLLPGESLNVRRPSACIRLIVMYGAADSAEAFSEWQTNTPPWLEVRVFELPGHGARASEGVWSLGKRQPECTSDEVLAETLSSERAAIVSRVVDELMPLINGPLWALYGFSAGAMLAYLVVIELQRRAAQLPFRLIVSGRGAPHNMHVRAGAWNLMRSGSDVEWMAWLNTKLAVPEEEDADALVARAQLWRATILLAAVHVGEPAVPPESTPDFPLASTVDSSSQSCPNTHACGALAVRCPVLVFGSENDKVWRWDLPKRWADVASSDFRMEQIKSVPHFKLMLAEEVREGILVELMSAAIAQARFG